MGRVSGRAGKPAGMPSLGVNTRLPAHAEHMLVHWIRAGRFTHRPSPCSYSHPLFAALFAPIFLV